MANDFYNIVGIIGASLILLGFYRISIGRWTGKSFWYELDNFFGACFVAIYQYHHRAYISIAINAVWATVAFLGISSYTERRLKRKRR